MYFLYNSFIQRKVIEILNFEFLKINWNRLIFKNCKVKNYDEFYK